MSRLWPHGSRELPDLRLRPIVVYPWLLALSHPVNDVLQGQLTPGWLIGGGLLLFSVIFVSAIHLTLDENPAHQRPALLAVAVLAVLAVGLAVESGGHTMTLFFLLSLAFGITLAPESDQFGPAVIVAAAGLAWITAWLTSADAPFTVFYTTLLIGIVFYAFFRLVDAITQLRQAREDLAHAAVAQERLRFSRDLHDLLGHTLSVIVVKAEVIRRVNRRDPEVAERQALDIESIGRQALVEIREAVTGYRQHGLAVELDGARAALDDAGIEAGIKAGVSPARPPLLPEADRLLGWVVREGVTNVIRHSKAKRCDIAIQNGENQMILEITDDGIGCPAGVSTGNGLKGLAERLSAAQGTLQLSAGPAGGFRLLATLPTGRPEPGEDG